MQQYIAQFKILYNQENGRHMDTNDGKEALKVCGHIAIVSIASLESIANNP